MKIAIALLSDNKKSSAVNRNLIVRKWNNSSEYFKELLNHIHFCIIN